MSITDSIRGYEHTLQYSIVSMFCQLQNVVQERFFFA